MYQISQEDMQAMPTRLFLPSAPMGAPRQPENTQRSLNQARAEREMLERQVRDSDALFTIPGNTPGEDRAMLQQPVQPTRRTDEPVVPRMRPAEFGVRQAGVRFRDQARSSNLNVFLGREEERQKRGKPFGSIVDQLAGSIGGQPQQQTPPQPPPPTQLPQLLPQDAAAVQQITPPPADKVTAIVAKETQP
ncbi:MAG: hypothetical protein GY844_00895, partial [Bradyrhizobium sp.]|nr:hypothetical protein [Bradyrhizobium sp.]